MRSTRSIRNATRVNSWKKMQLFYLTTERNTHKHTSLCQNYNTQAKLINLKQRASNTKQSFYFLRLLNSSLVFWNEVLLLLQQMKSILRSCTFSCFCLLVTFTELHNELHFLSAPRKLSTAFMLHMFLIYLVLSTTL